MKGEERQTLTYLHRFKAASPNFSGTRDKDQGQEVGAEFRWTPWAPTVERWGRGGVGWATGGGASGSDSGFPVPNREVGGTCFTGSPNYAGICWVLGCYILIEEDSHKVSLWEKVLKVKIHCLQNNGKCEREISGFHFFPSSYLFWNESVL